MKAETCSIFSRVDNSRWAKCCNIFLKRWVAGWVGPWEICRWLGLWPYRAECVNYKLLPIHNQLKPLLHYNNHKKKTFSIVLSHLMILPIVSIQIVFPAKILSTILAVIPILIVCIDMPFQMFLGIEGFHTKITRVSFSVSMHFHVFF